MTNNEWETPQELYNSLNNEFGFTLDPCATFQNKKHYNHYTKEDDGLSKSWRGEVVFMNPPYDNITAWVKKAYLEWLKNDVIVVALLPAWTDRIWFHEWVYHKAEDIRFLKGRVRFLLDGKTYQSPIFGSMVVVYND